MANSLMELLLEEADKGKTPMEIVEVILSKEEHIDEYLRVILKEMLAEDLNKEQLILYESIYQMMLKRKLKLQQRKKIIGFCVNHLPFFIVLVGIGTYLLLTK